jgi:hypothetical protein
VEDIIKREEKYYQKKQMDTQTHGEIRKKREKYITRRREGEIDR